VNPGDELTISGTGFRPNAPGTIRWQSTGTSAAVQNLGDFIAGDNGNFEAVVRVPDDPERVINTTGFPNTIAISQQWPVGDIYFTSNFELVMDKIVETIFLALMGTSIGVLLSIPLSFLASQNLMSHNLVSKTIYVITRTLLNILRSVEVLILAIIFVVAVGIGPFAGMLALAVHSVASLGKLYSEAIESIDPGPIEAITATGANRLQVIRYAVVPQFIPQFVSFTLYRWDINVRMSTVVGLVGGGGIGYILQQFIGLLDWHAAGTAIVFIALVVIAMDYASAKIRQAVI
jgi:phosphonate transport system permease protein